MSRNLFFKFDKRYPLLLRYILEKRGTRARADCQPLTLQTGWKATAGADYDLWWRNTRFPPARVFAAQSRQRVNHFINSGRITKKAGMIYYMKQYRKLYGPDVYNFMPPSLIISPRTDKKLFQLDEDISKRIWIVKPSSSSQGRGIRLINDLNSLDLAKYYQDWRDAKDSIATDLGAKKPRTFVVSQYIDNPFLISGYKHDIRLYVLVSSYHPLEVHLYREGLVRFATKLYDPDAARAVGPHKQTMFSHLTNTSINKFNPMFKKRGTLVGTETTEMRAFERAMYSTLGYGDLGKRTLRQLFNYFHREGIDYKPIWKTIRQIVLLTLLPLCHLVPRTGASCFELYGFDIMLDSKLKPWLIEVNFSPSLALETVTDQSIKEPLLEDVIDTLGFGGMHPGGSSRNKTIFPWEDQSQQLQMSGNFEKIFPTSETQRELAEELSSTVSSGPQIVVDDVDENEVAERQSLPQEHESAGYSAKLSKLEEKIVGTVVNCS